MCSCNPEKTKSGFEKGKQYYKISKIGKLPSNISESSGLAHVLGRETFWTHNDGGNVPELYEINNLGQTVSTLALPNLKNEDWEDIATDEFGNIYIADIGNNNNARQNLAIYKVNPQNPENIQKIALSYADQSAFPPPLMNQNFDCEAVVYQNQKLYLFSKNRSPNNRHVKLYELPAKAGTYSVSPIDSIYIKTMVTAADISPDQKTLALLTYGKVFLFDISEGMSLKKPIVCIKMARGQTEAILFINNQDFIITNEHKREIYLLEKR